MNRHGMNGIEDDGLEAASGSARPNSPYWMAEWAFHSRALDVLGAHGVAGPLEMQELSGRLESDNRVRHIRRLVDRLASRLAARLYPGAWKQERVDARDGKLKRPDGAQRQAAARAAQAALRKRACHVCGEGCRPRTEPDPDGVLRCGRCRGYRRRFGRERSTGHRFPPAVAARAAMNANAGVTDAVA